MGDKGGGGGDDERRQKGQCSEKLFHDEFLACWMLCGSGRFTKEEESRWREECLCCLSLLLRRLDWRKVVPLCG